ncbi:MAG: 30S ribosomal protein S6 [Opitutaceae bacterium]|jgi:small subunit ribosomal protein S6|nr:30S ribosomal protein S6 [Opitutaceae bacterium]
MKDNTRNYRATFILDNRGREEAVEQLVESLKKEIEAVGGAITAVENLGRRDFARVTDPAFPGAPYVEITFAAAPAAPALLKERLRLNGIVYRLFIQAL